MTMHETIQGLLYELGNALGYEAVKEFGWRNSRIDVVWVCPDDRHIIFEIDGQKNGVTERIPMNLRLNPKEYIQITAFRIPDIWAVRFPMVKWIELDLRGREQYSHTRTDALALLGAGGEVDRDGHVHWTRKDAVEAMMTGLHISQATSYRILNDLSDLDRLSIEGLSHSTIEVYNTDNIPE